LVNIFIVEDRSIVRDGIRSVIEREPAFRIVGEANSEDAIKNISLGLNAEIILMSLDEADLNNPKFLEVTQERFASAKVIVLSTVVDENYVSKAFRAGVQGYLLKTVGQEELLFAVKHIAAGEKYICSELSVKLIDQLTNNVYSRKLQVELSRRESEVLALIAEGYTNNEIANKLFTSRRTVEGHRQNLLDKTNTRNTAALIRFAVKNGLV